MESIICLSQDDYHKIWTAQPALRTISSNTAVSVFAAILPATLLVALTRHSNISQATGQNAITTLVCSTCLGVLLVPLGLRIPLSLCIEAPILVHQ